MFEEPEVLATFDRSFGDKKEQLRLERGEYQGKPTYSLRLYWQAADGIWRWASQKPTQSGKCWERLNLKAKELRDLGAALMAAADGGSARPAQPDFRATNPTRPVRSTLPSPSASLEDDIPF